MAEALHEGTRARIGVSHDFIRKDAAGGLDIDDDVRPSGKRIGDLQTAAVVIIKFVLPNATHGVRLRIVEPSC